MTNEEKQLLLKDLCTRLPYGIMVSVQGGEFDSYKYPYILTAISKFGLDSFCRVYHAVYTPFGVPNVEHVKPYLRPMSSMTMEERKYKLSKFFKIINTKIEGIGYVPTLNSGSAIEYINWLNENHFDYNHLIEKGLALEAPKEMYKINK